MTTISKKYQLIPNEPQFGMTEETQIFTSLREIYEVFTDECVNNAIVPDTIYLTDQNDDGYEIPLYDVLTRDELKDIQEIVESDLIPYEMYDAIWDYLIQDIDEKQLDKEIKI